MTLNVAEVAGRMRAVEESTAKGMRVTVTAAAMKAKVAISAGAPASLRGVGKGAKLGVRYTLSGGEVSPSAKLKATGPWQLIEENTSPHIIRPKRRSKSKGRGAKGAIVIPGIGARAYAHHPGTKGKHPWAKGVEKAEPLVAKEMSKTMANIATAAFRG
jgi:hypothetical protein